MAAPAARAVVIVLGLSLIALSGFCLVELLTVSGVLHRQPMLPGVLRWIDGLRMETWTPIVAGAGVAAGLSLVGTALRPRRKTHLGIEEDALWLRPTDVARLCSATAMSRPGVLRARTTFTPRQVTVTAHAGGIDTSAVESDITRAVTPVVSRLSSARTVRVRLTGES